MMQELSAHKNILSFEALVRPKGCEKLYLATEHVQGPSLHSLLEKQSGLPVNQKLYSDAQAGRWMLGLASALEFMHSQPEDVTVIHRDISVNNILLSSHNLKKAEAKLVSRSLFSVYSSFTSSLLLHAIKLMLTCVSQPGLRRSTLGWLSRHQGMPQGEFVVVVAIPNRRQAAAHVPSATAPMVEVAASTNG